MTAEQYDTGYFTYPLFTDANTVETTYLSMTRLHVEQYKPF